MIKTKKKTYIFLIIIILTTLILNVFPGSNEVYAIRSNANDLSNLVNYPSIYTLVRELQVAHPTWNFTMLYTGLNWSDVIYNETLGHPDSPKSLVQKYVMEGNMNDWICPTCGTHGYDNGSWYCASAKTVSYYMDIRNWLDEETVFSMESLSYDPAIQNLEGVKKILAGTFMDVNQISYIDTAGNTQVINKSYAQIFMEAGQANNVSPYALASRVRQEQGNGSSSLITGQYTYTNPETGEQIVFTGYYNYFNIKASGNGTANIIKNGLNHAKEKRMDKSRACNTWWSTIFTKWVS